MFLIGQIDRQGILFSQQSFQNFAAINPPHTLLLQLFVLLSQDANLVSYLAALVGEQLKPLDHLVVSLVHHHSPVLVRLVKPNAEALSHALLDAV